MRELRRKFNNTLYVILGTFLLCLAVELFILPFNILSGGVAGIAVILEPLTGWDKTTFANILTVSMLFIGYAFLGREFFINTVISSLCYPLFNSTLAYFVTKPDIDIVLASFYGGLLAGIGVGLVIKTGASTGGMDVPALILHKWTGAKIGVTALCIDGLTVLFGWSIYGLSNVLVGLVSVFVSSYAIDRVMTIGSGGMGSKSVQIISSKWPDMIDTIYKELGRGATIIDACGSRSREERKILLCVVDNNQYARLIEIIEEIDSTAFVITTDASDMHGEGFTFGCRI